MCITHVVCRRCCCLWLLAGWLTGCGPVSLALVALKVCFFFTFHNFFSFLSFLSSASSAAKASFDFKRVSKNMLHELKRLAEQHIRIRGPRWVTHLDISREDAERVADAVRAG